MGKKSPAQLPGVGFSLMLQFPLEAGPRYVCFSPAALQFVCVCAHLGEISPFLTLHGFHFIRILCAKGSSQTVL